MTLTYRVDYVYNDMRVNDTYQDRQAALTAARKISKKTGKAVYVMAEDGYLDVYEYTYMYGRRIDTHYFNSSAEKHLELQFVVDFASIYDGSTVNIVHKNKNAALAAARKFSKLNSKMVYVIARNSGVDLYQHTYYNGYRISSDYA